MELTVERVDTTAAAGDSAVEETARLFAMHGWSMPRTEPKSRWRTMRTTIWRPCCSIGARHRCEKVSRAFRRCADASFGLSSRSSAANRSLSARARTGFRHGQHERGYSLYAQPPSSGGRSRSAGIESAGGAGGSTAFASASAGRDLPAELCTDLCTALCSRERRVEDSASAGKPHRRFAAEALRLLENADMPLKDVTAKHITALEHLLETASPSAETDLPERLFADVNMTPHHSPRLKLRSSGRKSRLPYHLQGRSGRTR